MGAEPEVLPTLATELRAARDRGASFDQAWPHARNRALNAAPNGFDRAVWNHALTDTRTAWQAAYTGQPAAPALRPLTLLAR